MSKILLTTAKEGMNKAVEKAKEMKNNIETLDDTEVKEVVKYQRKFAENADIETAKNSSLASIIEKNKEKREIQEFKLSETNEGREGLTDEKKEKLRELTGWSDEIIDVIGSWNEAEIYMKSGVKEAEINGKRCLIRDDIVLDKEDEDGITNRERMERGRPPITKDGEEIELHHIGQKPDNPLAELTTEEHRGVGNDTILHDKTKESEIVRNEFAKERREHWKNRVESMEGGK